VVALGLGALIGDSDLGFPTSLTKLPRWRSQSPPLASSP